MAKDQEEIEDTDLDNKNNSDDEQNEDDEEAEDESEDEESQDDDSDDDDDKPLTRKDLKALDSKINALAAARRKTANKNGNLSDKNRTGKKEDDRIANLETWQRQQAQMERKRDFGYQNNLSPDEVDIVYRIVKRPTRESLKDPVVAGALDGHRESRGAKDNTPRGRGRVFQVNNKEFKDLKPEEKQSNFADRRRAILEGKKER